MRKIALISCGSKKLNSKAKARDLYIGPLFKYSLNFAELMKPHGTYILSAEHGLLDLDEEIFPYDKSLEDMSALERKSWANFTIIQLGQVSDLERDKFILLAGETYRKDLIPRINNYIIPLEGLGIGEQLSYLKKACAKCLNTPR